MAPMCNAALTVSLVAWDHERKLLENQSSRLESKKHQDLHQRKRGHAHLFDETIEEAFRERRRRKRQMSLVTLEDVSREKRDEEIQEEIRSIVRIVEDRRGRKNVEEKRKKKKKEKEKDAPEPKRKRVSVLCCCFGPDSSSSDRNVASSFSSSSRVLAL